MRIHNIRLGHATNSSSSHSMIFIPSDMVGKIRDKDVGDGEFGWQFFTAASKEAKELYLAALVKANLNNEFADDLGDILLKNWGINVNSKDAYIDHQSVFSLPREYNGNFIDKEFFEDFSKFILQDNLIILGGNDNSDNDHPLAEKYGMIELPLMKDYGFDNSICRKEYSSNEWVIFQRDIGRKIRFSFDDLNKKPAIKSDTPELVDIKLTNYCEFECPFCYQDSSREGKKTRKLDIFKLADILAEMKVFEVALGGGEATLDKNLLKIVKYFRKVGIVPNLTTRNMNIFKNEKYIKELFENIGGMGFSITPNEYKFKDQLELLFAYRKIHNIDKNKLILHVILGPGQMDHPHTLSSLIHRMDQLHFKALLLGYKTKGRAVNLPDLKKPNKKENKNWWIDILKKNTKDYHRPIMIDTQLAKEYEKELVENGVSNLFFRTEEGKFSCYIDAVEGIIAPSSYCDPEENIKLKKNFTKEDILNAFRKF